MNSIVLCKSATFDLVKTDYTSGGFHVFHKSGRWAASAFRWQDTGLVVEVNAACVDELLSDLRAQFTSAMFAPHPALPAGNQTAFYTMDLSDEDRVLLSLMEA